MSRKGRTRHGGTPREHKQTIQRADPDSTNWLHPSWSFRLADSGPGGKWSPLRPDLAQEVLPKLQEFEGMTWQAIQQQTYGSRNKSSNHPLAVATALTKEAQARLQQIHVHEDELFSLRISGKRRIIGVRDGAVLRILWYDRHHEVARTRHKNG